MDSTMLLMDVISAACAAYCAYTWVRLLRERKDWYEEHQDLYHRIMGLFGF